MDLLSATVIVLGLGVDPRQFLITMLIFVFITLVFYSAIIDFQLNLFQMFATENDALVLFVVSELHTVKHC